MDVSGSDITVNISRVHFKNARTANYGGAISTGGGTVNVESCIFSGHQTTGTGIGGAIHNSGTMNIKGCTFYNNSSAYLGGAISNNGSSATLTLTGNLFYGNTAPANGGPVVYSGTVNSNGYNVVDVALGTGTAQSGWTAQAGDKAITAGALPFSTVSFRLLPESGAINNTATLPAGYPATDFYGAAIGNNAHAGAVQSMASDSGYILNFSVSDSSRGSISAAPVPNADGFVSAGTVSVTATPETGYSLAYWLVNGANAGSTNPLSQNITEHTTIQAVFSGIITVTAFTDGSAATAGTLRYALTNVQDGDTIRFTGVTAGTTTIELVSALPTVSKNVTIEGNGVTLTRSAAWTTVDGSSQLLYIYNSSSDITVSISRVHFKNGRATTNGAAVYNNNETVNLESCIFSGNQSTGSSAYGGAIYTYGTMNVKGCTFYNNSAAYLGGAIFNNRGALTLTGNLFYGNTASNGGQVVYNNSGTVTSNGYNASQTGFGVASTTGDTTINSLPFTPVSFKLLNGSEAANVITTLPAAYPAADFYGAAISGGAAAGAVQTAVSGYYLELGVNSDTRGAISAAPAPDADGIVPAGTVTVTASPAVGHFLAYWLVDGFKNTSPGPLALTITNNNTVVQAVFGTLVTSFTDATGSAATAGTLRYALTNAQEGDIIRFTGVTPLTTALELSSALPEVSKSLTIEGNGVTLTRSASWNSTGDTSQLLYIYSSSAAITVNISQVYFKSGRATSYSAAIRNDGETVNLESCIFSVNQTTASSALGGVIYNGGTMAVNGCTFYNNISGYRGGSIYTAGTLALTGNLFYGNTASNGGPIVYHSGGYNVVNLDLGTATTESGWTAATGDNTLTALGITGLPLTTATFAPVTELNAVIPSAPADFPAADFSGSARTWPGAPGAVK